MLMDTLDQMNEATIQPISSVSPQTTTTTSALHAAIRQVNQLVLGKPETIDLVFCSLLAGGHVLLEDLPGLGKTTLANAISATLGLDFGRIQFTSDLLPADVIGISIYSQQSEQFKFQQGPIFNQIVLADEINRAPPRTQSAFLEAMAENHVTVDGKHRPLPQPFFVIATQNPVDLAGTWPLPDSQLDRFLLKLSLGYPEASAERQLLEEPDRQLLLQQARPQITAEQLHSLIQISTDTHCSAPVLDYVQRLLQSSRHHAGISVGLSPRAGLALLRVARAHAVLKGRDHVLPDDIKHVFVALAAHRIRLQETDQQGNLETAAKMAQNLLDSTAVS